MELLNNKLIIEKTDRSRIQEVDFHNIPFGKIFSDHMLVADVEDGEWMTPNILPYGKIPFFPSISALHYGQSIFEGLKAYKNDAGEIHLFRPEENFKRMNRSALRMCMPEIPHEIFIDGMKELLKLDRNWVPELEGTSLYIRPFYFATDEYVGIRASDNYKFIIFTCPVGAYYPEPVNLMVDREYVRAVIGGTGEAKAAGNYAASLLAAKLAQKQGYHNVLWLDAIERRYIEECGTMNIFFVIDGTVITPALSGSVLPGITRKSILTLLAEMNIPFEERAISIDEVVEASHAGKLDEAFGAGTAATIAHVNKIGVDGTDLVPPPIETRKIGPRLLKRLSDIRTGRVEDVYGWVTPLE